MKYAILAYPFTSYFARNCIKFDTTSHQLFISVRRLTPSFFTVQIWNNFFFFFTLDSNVISFAETMISFESKTVMFLLSRDRQNLIVEVILIIYCSKRVTIANIIVGKLKLN